MADISSLTRSDLIASLLENDRGNPLGPDEFTLVEFIAVLKAKKIYTNDTNASSQLKSMKRRGKIIVVRKISHNTNVYKKAPQGNGL